MKRTDKRSWLGLAGGAAPSALLALALGGAGYAAERMAVAGGTLADVTPGDRRDYQWRFGRIRYRTLGSGTPVLLLHGIYAGASAFEMRRFVEPLADQGFHVYVPDLLGFGHSDRPAIDYSAELYVDFVHDFIQDVVGDRACVAASSLSAVYAAQAATLDPDRFQRLLLICPAGVSNLNRPAAALQHLAHTVLKAPGLGAALYDLMTARSSIRLFLSRDAYADPNAVTDDLVDHYYRAAHQPGARWPVLAFICDRLSLDLRPLFARLPLPVFLAWGSQSRVAPLSDAQALLDVNPTAELRVFDGYGTLVQDECPADLATWAGSVLRARPRRARAAS
ncbi:MAG: alpha/beta fold hydrolase [Chloroflexi bacterium]|nr:alpha/beta fold hydrolase [Chloroflexota bacterium]